MMKSVALAVAGVLAGGVLAFGAAGQDPTGCPNFEVELPQVNSSVVVAAADFGFSVTNDDNAAALNRALVACRERKAARLVLAPGTYRCFGPKGVEVAGLTDFTLEGNGAVLVFWRKHPKDWDAKAGYYGVIGEPPPGKTAVDWQGLKAAFAADRPEWFVIEPVTSDRFDTISRSIEHLEGMEIV